MSELIDCINSLTAEQILRSIARVDNNGNVYLGVDGLGDVQFIELEGAGGEEWRFGIDDVGNFTVDNNVPGWTMVFET